MYAVRPQHVPSASPLEGGGDGFRPGGRLNLLLSTAPWRPDPWAEALPRVLEPMGVTSIRASSAREAERVIRSTPVHVAVVDLTLPMDERDPCGESAGGRVLELLSRLEQAPPTLVLKGPSVARTEQRHMQTALRCNAFAIVDRTGADLEVMLQLMQRVMARHYQGRWPG
jgi:DNA-binding NarL/FixJ family response regulator